LVFNLKNGPIHFVSAALKFIYINFLF